MAYLGNDLQVAYQSYKIIDDISSSFNSSLTSFPLQVGGVAPVPFPINPQQCLISVNGVVQEPDPTGTSGFNLVGNNIVFASAPTTGHSFFGVILAGADYVNVGVNYPSGSVSAPSITFDTDLDTGIYNPAANELGLVTNGSDALRINSSGNVTISSDLTVDTDTLYVDSANNRVGIGTTSPEELMHLNAASSGSLVDLLKIDNSGGATGTEAGIVFECGTDRTARISSENTGSDLGALKFWTAGSVDTLTERARIDSSGRLLVGTSSSFASCQLEINGTAQSIAARSNNDAASFSRYQAGSNGSFIFLRKSRNATLGSHTIVNNGDSLGGLEISGSDGTSFITSARIAAEVDGTPGANDMPGRLVFSTTADGASSPTERMRIGNQGNVSIGANFNTIVRLALTGQSSTSADFAFAVYNAAGTSLLQARNDGLIQTGIAANSPYNLTTGAGANVHVDAAGTLYRSTSSIRFKTDIESLEDSYADAILSIEPVWYRSTAPGDKVHPNWSYYGFIAEDVAKVDPRLVFWKTHEPGQDEDGNPTSTPLDEPIAEGVQYDRFVPHLLNLIKRQGEAIAELQAEVAALKCV